MTKFLFSIVKATIRLHNDPLVRYLAIGATLFLLDLSLFLSMVNLLHLDIRIAQAISRTSGSACGFLAHKYFTFRATRDASVLSWKRQSLTYVIAALTFNLLVSPFVLWGVVKLCAGPLILSKIIAEILFVSFSYAVMRLIFRTRHPLYPASPSTRLSLTRPTKRDIRFTPCHRKLPQD